MITDNTERRRTEIRQLIADQIIAICAPGRGSILSHYAADATATM